MLSVNKVRNHYFIILLWISTYQGKTIHVVYVLQEHSQIGFLIGDLRLNNKILENISTDTTELDFRMLKDSDYVSNNAGRLYVKHDIDRETICTKSQQCCCIDLLVFLYKQQIQTDYIEVRITIEDINDHAPSWSQGSITLNIPEHTKIGTKYRLPAANDKDSSPRFSITKYYVEYQEKTSKHMFSLIYNENIQERVIQQVWLKVDEEIDREKVEMIELKLIAEDSGTPSLSGSINLTINITDINDNEPYFESVITEVYIKENNQPNDYLCTMKAKDNDISDKNKLRYSFGYSLSQEEIAKFYINERTGKVYVKKSLDYENDPPTFNIPIQVTDGSNVAESTLLVKLQNENDNSPIIIVLPHVNSSQNTLMVEENIVDEKTLATITTNDIDNSTTVISCHTSSTGFSLRKIDSYTDSLTKYVLSLTTRLDRESEEWLQVIIICHDDGQPQKTARKIIKIQVLDINDCTPQFLNPTTTVYIDENLPRGSFVAVVNASDCDSGLNAMLVYEIDDSVSTLFTINKSNGVIRTNAVFDREKISEYRIVVNVYDRNYQVKVNLLEKILSSSTIVRVLIRDVNDCAPVFSKMFYEFAIAEESPPRMLVGSVSAEDADVDPINRRITFSMIAKPFEKRKFYSQSYFYISPDGGIYTTNKILDRESFDMFSFSIEARDGINSKHVVTVDVVIKIEDVNDNHPQWIHPPNTEYNVNVSQEETTGRVITMLRASDADIKENSDLHFQITQGNEFGLFRLDKKSGSLHLAKSINFKGSDVIRLILKVSDNGKVSLSNTTTLKVTIVREISWLSFEGRYLDKDLVVMICMISVTLIVSGILVVAIILLKCKHCLKPNVQDVSARKDNRTGYPDGRSSPTVSELDNSPQKMMSDVSSFHSHVCRPRGFIYETPPSLVGFQSINQSENLPFYYTLKSRTSISEEAPEQVTFYNDSQSPQIVSFHSPQYIMQPDYKSNTSSSPCHIGMQPLRHQSGGIPAELTMISDPNSIYSSSPMTSSNMDMFITSKQPHCERKVSSCVKWSDMVEDKNVYESFCRPQPNNNLCQMSKDQITSFV